MVLRQQSARVRQIKLTESIMRRIFVRLFWVLTAASAALTLAGCSKEEQSDTASETEAVVEALPDEAKNSAEYWLMLSRAQRKILRLQKPSLKLMLLKMALSLRKVACNIPYSKKGRRMDIRRSPRILLWCIMLVR